MMIINNKRLALQSQEIIGGKKILTNSNNVILSKFKVFCFVFFFTSVPTGNITWKFTYKVIC